LWKLEAEDSHSLSPISSKKNGISRRRWDSSNGMPKNLDRFPDAVPVKVVPASRLKDSDR
jgi:hypothetical protein